MPKTIAGFQLITISRIRPTMGTIIVSTIEDLDRIDKGMWKFPVQDLDNFKCYAMQIWGIYAKYA
jgi:hypothetical protein